MTVLDTGPNRAPAARPALSPRAQRLCIWAGLLFMVVLYVGFWVIAGFVPPPSPQDSAAETAKLFSDHSTGIRLGIVLTNLGSGLLCAWYGTLSVQLKRIEGHSSPWTYTQLVGGAASVVIFLIPCALWEAAAYRPDADPVVTQRLNDAAWLMFIGLVCTGIMQAVAVGMAILQDERERPVFPRWSGYLSIWVGLLLLPGALVPFFKGGPFAWTGVFAFWVVLFAFTIWVVALSVLLLGAVTRQEREEADRAGPAVSTPLDRIGALEVELAALRATMARTGERTDR
jgi:hypothetical protein